MNFVQKLFPAGHLIISGMFVLSAAVLLVYAGYELWQVVVPEKVSIGGRLGNVLDAIALLTMLARVRRRVTAPWACGLPGLTTRMQYTSASFSKPIRAVFAAVYKADRKLDVLPANRPYFPSSISYRSVRTTSFERSLYRPMTNVVITLATRMRRLQTGNIQVYLLYIFLTLVALLAVVGLRI